MPSIKSLFGSSLHPDLVKMQCEHGSKESYSSAQSKLNAYCATIRSVNNTISLPATVKQVGGYIGEHPDLEIPREISLVKELVIQADGGYVPSKDKDHRGFEALTTVVYSPDSIIPGRKKRDSGTLRSKHCAASAS